MVYTIIDIETNGLSTSMSEVLEVGYIQVNNKKLDILRSGEIYFYKDGWNIEHNEAFKVHGLTANFLREGCPNEEVFDDNVVKLYTLMYNGIIVGKNSDKFDIPLISSFIKRYATALASITTMATLDLQSVYTPRFRGYYLQRYGTTTRKLGKLGASCIMQI